MRCCFAGYSRQTLVLRQDVLHLSVPILRRGMFSAPVWQNTLSIKVGFLNYTDRALVDFIYL